MEISKSNILISTILGKLQLCAGIILGILFFSVTIYTIFTGEFMTELPAFIFVLLIDILALFLIIKSRRTNKLLKNIPVYSAALSTDATGFIPNLAAAMNTSEDVVKNNLRQMIAKRYVTNITLHETDNCVQFLNPVPKSNSAGSNTSAKVSIRKDTIHQKDSSPSIEMSTVKCENCGAMNTLAKGQVAECEYCGSAIKA